MDDASDIDRLYQPYFDTNANFFIRIYFVLGF